MHEKSPQPAEIRLSPPRRALLAAARRVLWPLLRERGGTPRRTLRERLSAFLRTASRGRLWRLVRQGAFALAVAGALLGATSSVEAIELADVAAGQGGFAVHGEGIDGPSRLGRVANAGDVNGDGISDAIVGRAFNYLPDRQPSYVVFGHADGAPIDVSQMAAGIGGFAIHPNALDLFNYSGRSVSGAGDVNGDGLADLLIGAPGADPGGRENAGASYVVFGKATTEAVELSEVAAGEGGFVIRGENEGDRSGDVVSGAGDVNGDGVPDLLIGGYVVFGKATTEAVELSEVAAGLGGFVIRGAGGSVSGAGDVNGDGLADLLIGAPGADPGGRENAGASYVVFGKATTEAVELSEVAAGEGGFVIRGENESDRSGWSVSGAGDVNGDGLADLLIGAPGADPGGRRDAGASYVVFGKGNTEPLELSEVAAGEGGFVIRGESGFDRSGWSVSGAGDVNSDGLADLLIGAPGGFHAWASYVVFGKATTEAVELSEVAAGLGGFVIRGENAYSVQSVSGTGDLNGDGLPDLLIGAPLADPGGRIRAGASYVVFGKATTEPVELSDIAAGEGGFVIRGENEDDFSGWSVSGAGDVNGDGLADLLTGAPYADPAGRDRAGASYVVFGKATTEEVQLSEVAAGEGGFVIRGENEGDRSGWSVSGAGDVNGDGLADVLVGAPALPAASYVVFGKATTESVELSEIAAGQRGFALRGAGSSVAGLGDLNGDGLDDVTIGEAGLGTAYVVFGLPCEEPGEPGLLHHWRMDQRSGLVAHDCVGGAKGHLIGFDGDQHWVEGQVGGALDFGADGTLNNVMEAEIEAVNAAETGGFTVAMWIQPGEAILTPGEYPLLVAPDETVGLSIINTERDGIIHDRVLLFSDGSLPDLHVGSTTLKPGVWYHVAITSTGAGGEKLYYVYGVLEEQVLFAPSEGGVQGEHPATLDGWASGTARVGASFGPNGAFHDTVYDDVRIYNVALTPEEIAVLPGLDFRDLAIFIRGDANADGGWNIADPVYLLNNLFAGGPGCPCRESCDINDDNSIDIADPIYMLNRLFGDGPEIPPPGGSRPPPSCGPDPGWPSTFPCDEFPPCE